MSARAKVLFVIFSSALVGVIESALPVPPATAQSPATCESQALAIHSAAAPRPCETPWASCYGRATAQR